MPEIVLVRYLANWERDRGPDHMKNLMQECFMTRYRPVSSSWERGICLGRLREDQPHAVAPDSIWAPCQYKEERLKRFSDALEGFLNPNGTLNLRVTPADIKSWHPDRNAATSNIQWLSGYLLRHSSFQWTREQGIHCVDLFLTLTKTTAYGHEVRRYTDAQIAQ